MVGNMSAEEKLRAVQLWNILSEKLQEIVNNSAADINALAFPQEPAPLPPPTNTAVPNLFFYPSPSKTPANGEVSDTNFTSNQQQQDLSKTPLRSIEADNSLASFSDIQCADDESIHMDGVCPLNLPLSTVEPSEINNVTETLLDIDKDKSKQFECTDCGVSFRTKGHLLDHSRKHTGIKIIEFITF